MFLGRFRSGMRPVSRVFVRSSVAMAQATCFEKRVIT